MGISDSIRRVGSGAVESALKPMNIIDFAESKQGFDMTLFPMQKLILKCYYRMPLSEDINENKITVRDMFNDKILHEFNEVDCLEYLYSNKLCNLNYEDIYVKKLPFNNLDFYIGRRGSKTKMTVVIMGYTLYELLFYDDPHSMFNNKPVTDEISITMVSNKLSGANRQYRELTGLLRKSKFFKPFIAGSSKDGYWLKTRAFIRLENQGLAENLGNILIKSAAANYGVRGDANISGGLDEFCHYMDSANNDIKEKPLDQAMYEALSPSTFEFVTKEGRSFGKMFILSSPNGKKGEGYKRYKDSFEHKTTLMFNMPSFYVNQTLNPNELKAMYKANPSSYEQEILGYFNAKVSKWIENGDLLLCSSNLNNPNRMGWNVQKYMTYYLGIDFALANDLASFVVSHKEPCIPTNYLPTEDKYAGMLAETGDIYVIDYIYSIQAEEGKPLSIDDLCRVLQKIIYTYNIRKATADQWSKDTIIDSLKKYSISNVVDFVNSTQATNHSQASIYKQLTREGRIITPNDEFTKPVQTRDWDLTYLEEVFQLVETKSRNGMIKVENPAGHDDRYKAAEKAIHLTYTNAGVAVGTLYSGSTGVATSISNSSGTLSSVDGLASQYGFRNSINKRDMSKQIY